MPKLQQYWIAFVMICSTLVLPTPTFAAGNIIISEIAWAGSSVSASDEWIELQNLSETTTDLSGWTLHGAGGGEEGITLPEGSVIGPNSTFLIANYGTEHENSALATEPHFTTTSLSLPNSGFYLNLHNNEDASIDVAGSGGTPFAGRSGGTASSTDRRYASMVRVDGLINGTLEENWVEAEAQAHFKDEVTDLGTPQGIPYSPEVPITEPEAEEGNKETETKKETQEEMTTEPTEETPDEPEEVETPQEKVQLVEETPSEPEESEMKEEEEEEEHAKAEEVQLVEETPTEPNPQTEQERKSETENTDLKPEQNQSPVPVVLRITELSSNPEDGNEWIELENKGSEEIDLTGWVIQDASGKGTSLEGTVKADAYHLIHNPAGKLNNSGDTIQLLDPENITQDEVTFGTDKVPAPSKGEVLALNGETFHLTQIPTPGTPNLIFMPIDPKELASKEEEKKAEQHKETEEVENKEIPQENNSLEETQKPTIVKTLQLESIYPNTLGSDREEEFIEIKNVGTELINLEGWKVADASGAEHTLETMTIEPDKTFRLSRTTSKLALNNTKEEIALIAPDQSLVDLVEYQKASKGAVYRRSETGWNWDNTMIAQTPTSSSTSNSRTTSNSTNISTSTAVYPTIAQAKETTDGARVQVTGVVSVAPKVLGKQIFYIQDQSGGIQVYLHSSNFPELSVGENVSVTGTVSTNRSERRIKLGSTEDISNNKSFAEIMKSKIAIADLNMAQVGSMITVEGTVQTKSANKLVLEQEGEELTIYLNSTPTIATDQFARGDQLIVNGILSAYDNKLRLRPRSTQDIEKVQTESEIAGGVGSINHSNREEFLREQSQTGALLLAITSVVFVALALMRLLPRRKLTAA